VCVSGVCDTADNKCGLANNDGPCTVANGGTVCRSTACSTNGKCMPLNGCNADADCSGGNWCNITAHACTAKVANGGNLPSDPAHTTPVLNATCTAAAAALVCVSGVCDADNKCGLANNDGPCTLLTGGTVCRSATCSVSGTCMAAGACNADGDCSGGNWCNITAHTCTPKIANGGNLPSDPAHSGPTLNATCTAAAAALVCVSGVCDTDNKCGLVNNDGPCTAANGGSVCRSGVCDADGKCGLANGDGACTVANGATICRSGVCDGADGKCGLLNGDGACTVASGAAICRSGVCDTDSLCGLAVGDGPCSGATATVVCRSLACSTNGTCVTPGGCNADGDCTGGNWCNISIHACAPQIGNGGVMPVDSAHANPTLDGKCTTPASTLVCVSAVCDALDDRCGYANGDGTCDATSAATVCRSAVCDTDSKCGFVNGDGPCTVATGPLVCRSSTCSPNGAVCMPAGGCAVDADCGASEWCNSETFTCKPRLPNGTLIPSVAGHTPALAGTCTVGAGAAVCASDVCDTADNLCGYADGDGPCTALDGIVVCRSGTCSTTGVCEAAGACNADADCDTLTQYCDTGVKKCAPKLPNGTALPTVAGHTPALDGVCSTTEAPVVCQSAVCDPADSKCGYQNGDGPCTVTDAGTVCRSSTCSPSAGVCVPSGGCAVDADCASTQWCNTETFACAPKLANGVAVPTVAGHTPALTGTCTTGAGAAVCASGVCDTADDKCGYANGDGPCTNADAGTVCREGACTAGGVCTTPADCVVDSDCDTAFQYCDNVAGKCAPKVPNGSLLPGVMGHSPVLDGTCSDAAAKVVCLSGVCDPEDDKCGHATGKGPCDAGTGPDVCRSTICAVTGPSAGLCVECAADTQCAGSKPVCDTAKNACVQCTPAEAAACTGATPVCVPGPDTCAPCDGDLGSNTAHACGASGAPYCFLSGLHAGECGKCTGNADCQGHPGGPFCDLTSGACGTDCHSDGDCAATEWCNAPANGGGTCVPKLDNGAALPGSPPEVVTCTAAVGTRVCKSGVCDPADDKCGLANGDGVCTTTSGATVCRSGVCDADGKCGLADGDGPCTSSDVCRGGTCDLVKNVCGKPATGCTKDADCPEADFCATDGTCKPKLPDGKACTGSNQCQSDACNNKVCDSLQAAGNGLICAARPGGDGSGGAGVALLGLMFAAAGLARRRRR
jgi:hypothetical protein